MQTEGICTTRIKALIYIGSQRQTDFDDAGASNLYFSLKDAWREKSCLEH